MILKNRYSAYITKAASKTAKDIHRAFEAQVVRELATSPNDEAQNLAAYLSAWRRRANRVQIASLIVAYCCLGVGTSTSNPLPKLLLFHSSMWCWSMARSQRQTAEELSPIAGCLARIAAAQTAVQLVQMAQVKATSANAVIVDADGKILLDAGTEPLQFFDWNEAKNPDRYPHFLIAGATGSGKTYAAERIIRYMECDGTLVITPKRKPSQWEGLQVIGEGRKFHEISAAFGELMRDLQYRTEHLDREWPQKLNVIDEWPSIVANCGEDIVVQLTTLIREARESRIRIFLLSQSRQVKSLGLEGQSDLRENLCDILLGQFAVDRAKDLVRRKQASPELVEWMRSQKHPLLVADQPAVLPGESPR